MALSELVIGRTSVGLRYTLRTRHVRQAAAMLERIKRWARSLKRDVVALWIAARDPRTPWLAKVIAACVAAYALSSIDLIPDFIPVLGYLDDLLLVPLGVALAIRLIPRPLMVEFRQQAEVRSTRPRSVVGAGFITGAWLFAVVAGSYWLWLHFL